MSHDASAPAEDDPGEQTADERVADADKGRRDAVFPAELSRIADENDGREVGGSVRERGQPGTDRASAEHEAVDVSRAPTAVYADRYRHGYEYQYHQDFSKHTNIPFELFSKGQKKTPFRNRNYRGRINRVTTSVRLPLTRQTSESTGQTCARVHILGAR